MSDEKYENRGKMSDKPDNVKSTEQELEAFPGYKDIETFTKDGFKILVDATRNSNALPTDRDWDFYNTNGSFTSLMNEQGDNILRLMNTILRNHGIDENIRHRGLDEKIELVIDANDTILERVANNIDEANGIRKTPREPILIQTVSAQLPISGSWNRINKATFSVNSPINTEIRNKTQVQSIHLLTAKNILRPQKFFKDKINNSNKYPWEPRITEKPNSIKPLALYMEETAFGESFSHPYETELESFKPIESQLVSVTAVQPKDINETPLHEINTPEALDEMLAELRTHTAFAVDLEHHSYRTFMGITCLMQISTSDDDYLIDTLVLRDKMYILNEVFTKPTIVKIFHGADLDVQWLQRDLSLYVVNMFDTHQAAKQLGYSGLSLAYLLNRFCHFMPNKHFQLADWRIRPLPDNLKNYAREDTHYLIYLYQMLRNELIKQGNGGDNILRTVLKSSTEICKKRYFKPILKEDTHLDFYRKCKRMFDNRQMYALKHLYSWRDHIAREEDESTGYVLPNHMLLQVAEALPREMQGILACCNPIPPLVRANLLELHQIILRAREQSLQKPVMREENRSRGSTQQFAKINVDSPLYCPHDLTKSQEFRDDLPILLEAYFKKQDETTATTIKSPNININDAVKIEKCKSVFSVFNILNDEMTNEPVQKIHGLKFLGPYERYKMVKPYIQAEEEKAAAKKQKEKDDQNPAEEDKIASLHEHFVKTNKEHSDIKEAEADTSIEDRIAALQEHVNTAQQSLEFASNEPQSLTAMGGSRKRKRNFNEDYPEGNFETDFQTPVPEMNRGGQKRRYNEQNYNEQYNAKRGKFDRANKNAPKSMSSKEKKKLWYKQNILPCMHERHAGNDQQGGSKQRDVREEPDDFRAYDYSSVDFKQFQGGARGARGQNNVRSNFKARGKSKRMGERGNNRSMTYGTRAGRGSYRGRGRGNP